MSNQTIDEVSEILEYIMENNTVPPNIPVHARTLIWEVLSKLESI